MLDLKAIINLALCEGLWLATGFNLGIGAGWGSGKFLAKWITSGHAPSDMTCNCSSMPRKFCQLLKQRRPKSGMLRQKFPEISRSSFPTLPPFKLFFKKNLNAWNASTETYDSNAEFEHSLINERTKEGRAIAKADRVKFGRKPKLTTKQISQIKQERAAGNSATAIAVNWDIIRKSVHRALSS